ncbi:MAG: MbnP family protein, partial [Cytophagales bacterium]
MNSLKSLLNIVAVLTLVSCVKKKEDPKGFEKGMLDVELSAKVGNKALELNNEVYTNEKGNKFEVTMFKYYVTNIHLIDNQGGKFLIPNSYCLFDQGEAGEHSHNRMEHGNTAHLDSARVGTYDSIQVMIGVDVIKNHSLGNRGDARS